MLYASVKKYKWLTKLLVFLCCKLAIFFFELYFLQTLVLVICELNVQFLLIIIKATL